jgi:hypothetical protein
MFNKQLVKLEAFQDAAILQKQFGIGHRHLSVQRICLEEFVSIQSHLSG